MFTSYVTYQCSTCKRKKDVSQDNLRVFVDTCSITDNCLGKLKPIGTKKVRSALDADLDSSLPNKQLYPYQPLVTPVEYLSLNTGMSQITLAIKNTSGNMLNKVYIRFNTGVTSTSSFKEFVYQISNFSIIRGADNSIQKNVLKFSNDEIVIVYFDGVEVPDINYTLQNTNGYSEIIFNSPVATEKNIRVTVFSVAPIQYTETLEFTKNSLISIDGVWTNVQTIEVNNDIWDLYTSTEISKLPLGDSLNLYPGDNALTMPLENYMFLTSNPPSSASVDRSLFNVVSLDNLNNEKKNLKLSLHSGQRVLQYTPSSMTNGVQIIPKTFKSLEKENQVFTASLGQDDQIILPSHILGVI